MNILIAGVGNIFLGDDAFGVEVAQQLASHPFPEGVRVRDFGINGIDLGYALSGDLDAAIIVDTAQRGGAAGSLYVIDPDSTANGRDEEAAAPAENSFSPHSMDPVSVFAWARQIGGGCKQTLLVCCEPESFGVETAEQGRMGLSAPVQAAVPRAVQRIEALVAQLLETQRSTSHESIVC